MSVVDKLVIELSFDDVGFEKSAKKVNDSVKKVSKTTEDELKKGLNKKTFEDQSKVVVNVMSNTAKSIGSVLSKGLAGVGAVIGAKFAIEFAQAFGEKGKNLELNASTLNFNRQGGQLIEKLFGRVGNSANAGGALSNLSKSINSFTGNSNLAKFLGTIGKTVYDNNGQKKSTDVLLGDIIEGLRDYGAVAGKDKQLASFNELGILPPEILKLAQLPKGQYQNLVKDILPTILDDKDLQKRVDTAEKFSALNDRIAKLQSDSGDVLYDASEKLVNLFEYLGNAVAPVAKTINSVSDLFGGLIGAGGYRGAKLNYNAADLQNPEKRKIIEAELKNQKTIPDYFKKLYGNIGDSFSGLGSSLKNTSPFLHTNASRAKITLSPNSGKFNDLLNVIGQKESNNGRNINDSRYPEGSPFRGYGKYQVTSEAFKDVHGRNITAADKMNQKLLDETAQKYMQLGIEKYGAKTVEEKLAFWNGGPEGIDIVRSGYNSSKYNKNKINNLQNYIGRYSDTGILNNPTINPAELNSKSAITNTTSKSVTNNFHGDIQLPGVKNTTDFAKSFGSIGSEDGTIYGFSRGYT
jgi:hypothetical protein